MRVLGARVPRPGHPELLGLGAGHIDGLSPGGIPHVTSLIPPEAAARIRPLDTAG